MSLATPTTHSLHATIRAKLRNSGFRDLREVRVCGGSDELRLSGTVHSYYMKAMAASLVITVPGVVRVENGIEVS